VIFDHIGLFVRDIEEGRRQLQALLPIESWGETVEDTGMNVCVQFGRDRSGIRYELVAPLADPNPVSGALAAGKNLLNHVAYRCADLDATARALRGHGAVPIGRPGPAAAFGGRRVAFFLTRLGFIVELVEDGAARPDESGGQRS
jgi:methylmalonyl-CoA/ethylmalonyl-CoA epimerase